MPNTVLDFKSNGLGVAIGKASEENKLEIAMDVKLTGKLEQETLKTPTLQNGWVNFEQDFASTGYFKDTCGVVHLTGMIKSGTTTADTTIFTLDTNYRPSSNERFYTVSNNDVCVIDILSTGDIVIKYGANSNWITLSGISFRVGG